MYVGCFVGFVLRVVLFVCFGFGLFLFGIWCWLSLFVWCWVGLFVWCCLGWFLSVLGLGLVFVFVLVWCLPLWLLFYYGFVCLFVYLIWLFGGGLIVGFNCGLFVSTL